MHWSICAILNKILYHIIFADKAVGEQIEAIRDTIIGGGLLALHPIGPLMDYITSPKAKDVIPTEALYTFLVFSSAAVLAAKEALQRAKLPIPTFGLVNYDPNEQLYPGLPAMQDHWKRALETIPPAVANYLIDQYEIEAFFPSTA